MKKLFFAIALAAILLPYAPQAKSQAVSVDFFYDNLNGGSWIEVGDYGYCWQPDVAADDPTWRPYADGYWAYTDLGWTWVSYEDFGWATYHYGRWVKLADYGWVWRPGYEWGPAWVSWRFGGGYAGWAPLPPETEVVYESRPLTGHLDVEFDIGPAYYNFVDVRYIGEPVLRSRIVPYEQNITYVTQTVNVTNITYKNKTVYNYGPDLTTVNQYSTRPIQTLKLERQTNVDPAAAAKSGGLTKVQGNALVVAAPTEIKKTGAPPPPPKVKAKVEKSKVEKGWSVVGDEQKKEQLKQQLKAENPKNIPPPSAGANAAVSAAARASVSPGISASPAVANSPFEKGKGRAKGKQVEPFQAGASASAGPTAANAMTSPSATAPFQARGGKQKGRGLEQTQPGASTSPIASPSVGVSPEYGKPGKGKRNEQFGQPPAGAGTPAEQFNPPRGGKNKKFEQPAMTPIGPQNTPTTPQGGPYGEGRGKHKQFEQQQPGMSPAGAEGAGPYGETRGKNKRFEQPQPSLSPGGAEATGPYGEPRGKRKAEGFNVPPSGAAQTPAGQAGPYGEERGKRKAEGMNPPPGGPQGPVGPEGQSAGKHEGKGKGQGQTPTPAPQ